MPWAPSDWSMLNGTRYPTAMAALALATQERGARVGVSAANIYIDDAGTQSTTATAADLAGIKLRGGKWEANLEIITDWIADHADKFLEAENGNTWWTAAGLFADVGHDPTDPFEVRHQWKWQALRDCFDRLIYRKEVLTGTDLEEETWGDNQDTQPYAYGLQNLVDAVWAATPHSGAGPAPDAPVGASLTVQNTLAGDYTVIAQTGGSAATIDVDLDAFTGEITQCGVDITYAYTSSDPAVVSLFDERVTVDGQDFAIGVNTSDTFTVFFNAGLTQSGTYGLILLGNFGAGCPFDVSDPGPGVLDSADVAVVADYPVLWFDLSGLFTDQ